MAIVDSRTAERDYQLPDPTNNLSDDVVRLIAALQAIDADAAALFAALAGKAELLHQHGFADIPGLQEELNGKAALGHAHALNDLSDVDVAGAANGHLIKRVGGLWVPVFLQIGDVQGLQDALENPASHNHDDLYYRISAVDMMLGTKVPTSRTISVGGLATGGGDLSTNRTINVPKAAAADMRAGTDDAKALTTKAAYDSAALVPLVYASVVTINFNEGYNRELTLGGSSFTLANPQNARPGQTGCIKINTNGTNRSWAAESSWITPGGIPDLSSSDTTAYIFFFVESPSRIIYSFVGDPT